MVTVPVCVPSYDQSGDAHHVAVGDRVAWELAVIDVYLPEFLLQTFDLVTEVAKPLNPPDSWTDAHIDGCYVRRGSFVAWWHPDHPAGDRVQLRPVCAIGDSRLPDGGIPKAAGVITRMYWALALYRQRESGPWEIVPGIGLTEVASTEVASVESYNAYFPQAGVDAHDGRWAHVGWIAMLESADEPDADQAPLPD